MLPKPSVVLQVKLMPEDYSDAAAAEIKRSFIYLAQSVVSELPESERADGNIMCMSVRLMKPYWNSDDPAAQQLWRESFMPTLRNLTRNMSTAMHNFNTVLHPFGSGNVVYEWAEYDFAPNAVLRIKMDDQNRIPSEAPQWCDKVRTLMGQGVLGDDVALIRMPSLASLEAQRAAAEAARAAAEAGLDAAVEEPGAAAEVVAAAEAVDDAVEIAASVAVAEESASGEPAAEPGADVVKGAAETVEVEEAEEVEEVPSSGPAPLDYRLWDIVRSDGTVVEFDSAAY